MPALRRLARGNLAPIPLVSSCPDVGNTGRPRTGGMVSVCFSEKNRTDDKHRRRLCFFHFLGEKIPHNGPPVSLRVVGQRRTHLPRGWVPLSATSPPPASGSRHGSTSPLLPCSDMLRNQHETQPRKFQQGTHCFPGDLQTTKETDGNDLHSIEITTRTVFKS